MDKPIPTLMFEGMSFLLKLRDLVSPRQYVLNEVDIKPGFTVLDYGCGPGGYIVETAKRVGNTGMVYALDIHPRAIQKVQTLARKKGLTNVQTIHSKCKTGLPDNSVDIILLYDIFHMFSDPDVILAELNRVLKPSGTLSFNNHHMQEKDIVAGMTHSRLFSLSGKNKRNYSFVKKEIWYNGKDNQRV